MTREDDPIELTPKEFEQEVKQLLEASGIPLASFAAQHREKLAGIDGVYEIDVSIRFQALDAKFVVLVECKHQKNPIKRDVVQVLHDRIRSTGAHKGMIFATTGFQRGAIEYATQHGIALVRWTKVATCWITKSADAPSRPPTWANIPPYVGWRTKLGEEGNEIHTLISVRDPEHLIEFLALPTGD